MVKKIVLTFLVLFVASSLSMYASNEQQNETSKTVKLVVSGEGDTKDEATKSALRSAIEQAFGTFVSSNTDILNDDVVKDEIATVSSGNIQSYKELSYTDLGSTKMVNIEAVVSIGKLVSFAKSKGMSAELAGATFAMNMKMKELNKQNEKKVLENLYKQLEMIVDNTSLFDFKLKVGEPYQTNDGYYGVDVYVSLVPNSNMNDFWDLYFNTIKSIKLTKDEADDLYAANIPAYPYFSGYHYRFEKNKEVNPIGERLKFYDGYYYQNDIVLRNEYGHTSRYLSNTNNLLYHFYFPFFKSMCNFKIVDNLGNEFKIQCAEYTTDGILDPLGCNNPFSSGTKIGYFGYGKNKKYEVTAKGFTLESYHIYKTYRKFMDSQVRNTIDIKWLIELKYSPDDLMKITSLDIVPTFDKIQYFERNKYQSLK